MSPGQLAREPIYQQIAGFYAEKIRGGDIAPGEKLPSAAQLSKIWRVANATATAAIVALREAGLVQTSRRGTYACQAK